MKLKKKTNLSHLSLNKPTGKPIKHLSIFFFYFFQVQKPRHQKINSQTFYFNVIENKIKTFFFIFIITYRVV